MKFYLSIQKLINEIYSMDLNVKELVRVLLKREMVKQKDLAAKLSERTGKKYTPAGFAQQVARGAISYDEFVIIADILGYDVIIQRRNN